MLGSQAIQYTGSIAGYEIGVPEIFRFGYAQFQSSVATSDDWAHHQGAELVFLLEGDACWELEDDFLVPLSAGQCALFPSQLKHRITNGIYPPCASFWMVMTAANEQIRPAMLTDSNRTLFESALGRSGLTRPISEQGLNSISSVIRIMKDKRIYSGAPLLISELRAHLHLIMVETWKAHETSPGNEAPDELVQKVLEIIHDDVNEWPQVSVLAQRLGCTRGHLHAVFRREVGMAPSDYVQRLRIKKACEWLSDGALSITDIAHDMGFASSQHFSRTFRKYLGLTPTDYRGQRYRSTVGS